jgi:hypothetical protein
MKIGLILVISVTIASAWFVPKTGLGHADSNNIDKSFVRADVAWYFDLGRYGTRDITYKFRTICVRNFKK